MNYAIVDGNGNVINVVSWDGKTPWSPGAGLQAIPDPTGTVGIGWTFVNGAFVAPQVVVSAPPPPTPDPVSQFLVQVGAALNIPVPMAIQTAANPTAVASPAKSGA
jgi:hypothetical protein